VPTNLAEFEDDTAFERYVLDRATPLLPQSQAMSVIELGQGNSTSVAVTPEPIAVHVQVFDSTGSGPDQLSLADVRPLLFGAAWKVLDLLTEFGLELAGVPHDAGSRYTIEFKVGKANSGNVTPVVPFGGRTDLWTRVMGCYASTEDLRHSLVHRRLIVNHASGKIAGVAGTTVPELTSSELTAFCQVAIAVAEAVIGGELPTRRADQLGWALVSRGVSCLTFG
jgi:hypothetical protein